MRFRKPILLAGVILLLGSTPRLYAESGATINIQTFQFQPKQIEVQAGTTVTWVNQDDVRHTVTSGAPDNKDGRFDATLSGKGAKFSFTFSQPGTYTFFCDRHQHMRGEITVK
ncbi:MAG TPA: plastocyanin/azurin family copper-binding protein [Candidatus Binatia bacterium]|nr:plastocyanin/azurin family copper-binding protein [Candidatus Binatia bacterium]